MQIEKPFHEGELAVQQRTGESAEGARNGQVIMDRVHPGAARLIERQQLLVIASLDEHQKPWASIVLGPPGFMDASAQVEMRADLTDAHIATGDRLLARLQNDGRTGALIIDLAARLRVRVNGHATIDGDQLRIAVSESYPNCPKYIQRRRLLLTKADSDTVEAFSANCAALGAAQKTLITMADTFFIASVHPQRGVDASHRGGMPGFVALVNDRTLRVPDYIGNSMYNTLGNLTVNPAAGLVFLDFNSGTILQLMGKAAIEWEQDDVDGRTGGTGRFWTFQIESWRQSSMPVAIKSDLVDYSPYNPGKG